jgi:KDO2-lipid IV(A) lauroyltransferase
MQWALYILARVLILGLQALPLQVVAALGRAGGILAYWVDGRHRRVALDNLRQCFGEDKSPAEIRALARKNFSRIGENYACGIRTAGMSDSAIDRCLEIVGDEKVRKASEARPGSRCVMATGHFGNFELYAWVAKNLPEYKIATTYRGLRQPALDRLLQSLRARSGCLFFERRTQAKELRAAMNRSRMILGLLVDQHAGDRGVQVPFFGRDCSTSVAPAVFAHRYGAPLFTAFCFRVASGRWRIELGEEIPTHHNGTPRSSEAIARDMNLSFEQAIRRDPANWFWVHKRWKPAKQAAKVAPAQPEPRLTEQP